jgi:diguanylate cyclase (GGDEF)-like protein
VDELERRIRVKSAGGERCAVVFIDLDRFKPVNDSLGHAAGNDLLVEVGRRLETLVGPSDMAARIGGDEFVILIDMVHPDDSDGQLGAMADAICAVISRPICLGANEVAVSCSVGLAVSRPGDGGAELLRRADLAMYRAKRHGKAQWVNYRADIDEEVVDRLQLENDLRKALQGDTVDVHYQGILDLSDGSLVAVESLVRWHHPVRGPQQPDVLLPIAEDSGLILDLGDRVLDRTFEQGAVWQSQYGEAAPLVAVNVSPRQLIHPRFFPSLDSVMSRTRIDPSKVILEVTENIVGWGEDVEALLEQVKDRGLRLALDDFGAGQTSLRHLRRFPIDILKIDKEFIQRGDRQHHDRAILSSIIDMAHQLDLIVIAEGVEKRPQLEMLAQLGCDLVQGYLLHEPCEPGRLTSLLTGQSARRPPSSPADAQDSVTWGAGLH